MKLVTSIVGVTALVLVVAAARPVAQTGGFQAEVLKDLTNNRETMLKIADAMPEEKFLFKATAAERTYGEQILHVAGGNVALFKMLGAKAAPPTINQKATAKADVLKALADSYDFGIAVVKEQNDQSLLQTVAGPSFRGASSRVRLVNFAIAHAQDIYGQMVVYLRLNGIVPPASRSSV